MSDKNSTIDQMAEKYDSVEELRAYSNAQYKTIIKLTKRLAELEDKNNKLKEEIGRAKESSVIIENPDGISDEEAICIMELNRLRNKSLVEELTMEECRKVETYVKTLYTVRSKTKKEFNPAAGMSAEDLLKEYDNIIKMDNS